jgi:hypothetical protein
MVILAALALGACSSAGPSAAGATTGPGGASAQPLPTLPNAGSPGGGSMGAGQVSAPAAPSFGIPTAQPGAAGTIPCDKLGPLVTQITGLPIASVDAAPDDCSFAVNPPGDSSTDGFGGIVDIRLEGDATSDFDTINRAFVGGSDAVEVTGVGDRALRNATGNLMYAIHNGRVWAVQQELLVTQQDVPGTTIKLMQALFSLV